ncbi:hypothetical protein [Micromonospora sp. DT233]|uniref:hypothetical protein n=1 Tax=Micromonospora sp. DT233 TaxID=3393432 RepID=UPI003CF1F6F7
MQIGADRSARLLDRNTGQVLRSWPEVADRYDLVAARDDRLYVVDNTGSRYRLLAYDLTRTAEPTVLHTAADPDRRAEALVACGQHRACLLEATSGDREATEVVLAGEGVETRRQAAAGATELFGVGGHLVVRREYPQPASTLLGPKAEPVLRDRDGVAVRLDAGNVLLFADPLSSAEGNRSLAGLAVGAPRPHELGEARDIRSETCSWNTSALLCGAAEDFVLYRFTPRT